jgi:hypothetical protein
MLNSKNIAINLPEFIENLYCFSLFIYQKYENYRLSLKTSLEEYNHTSHLISAVLSLSWISLEAADIITNSLQNKTAFLKIFEIALDLPAEIIKLINYNGNFPLDFSLPTAQHSLSYSLSYTITDKTQLQVYIKFLLFCLGHLITYDNFITDLLIHSNFNIIRISSILSDDRFTYVRETIALLENIFSNLKEESLLLNLYSFIDCKIKRINGVSSFLFENDNTIEKTKTDLLSIIPEYIIITHSEQEGVIAETSDSKLLVINIKYLKNKNKKNKMTKLLFILFHECSNLKRMNSASTFIADRSPLASITTDQGKINDIGNFLEELILGELYLSLDLINKFKDDELDELLSIENWLGDLKKVRTIFNFQPTNKITKTQFIEKETPTPNSTQKVDILYSDKNALEDLRNRIIKNREDLKTCHWHVNFKD